MIWLLSFLLACLVVSLVYVGHEIGRLYALQARPVPVRLTPEFFDAMRHLVDQMHYGQQGVVDAFDRLLAEWRKQGGDVVRVRPVTAEERRKVTLTAPSEVEEGTLGTIHCETGPASDASPFDGSRARDLIQAMIEAEPEGNVYHWPVKDAKAAARIEALNREHDERERLQKDNA